MKKPLNVHFSANIIDNSVIKFLSKDFELNIINISEKELKNPTTEILEKIKSLDLIIFVGGEDVNPESYGQEIGKYTQINRKRDNLEFELLYPKKIASSTIKKIPKLGLCRGAQLLTVYNGAQLIQHVEGHKNNEQIIDIGIGSQKQLTKQISVSSDHHQMMFPYNLSESSYELIGWSTHFQSNTYLNGINEEIKLPKNFLEPEIVYYPGKNSLCIQSHPEWCIDSEGSNYCLSLIHKYLFKNEIKEQLPAGLPEGDYPIGWNAHDIDDNHYKFDGEKFITAEEFNNIGISEFIIRRDNRKKYSTTQPVESFGYNSSPNAEIPLSNLDNYELATINESFYKPFISSSKESNNTTEF